MKATITNTADIASSSLVSTISTDVDNATDDQHTHDLEGNADQHHPPAKRIFDQHFIWDGR